MASLFLSTLLIAVPAITFSIKICLKIKDMKNDNLLWYFVLILGLFITVLVSFSVLCLSSDDYFEREVLHPQYFHNKS